MKKHSSIGLLALIAFLDIVFQNSATVDLLTSVTSWST